MIMGQIYIHLMNYQLGIGLLKMIITGQERFMIGLQRKQIGMSMSYLLTK